jgi:hypothetical protein
MKFVHIPDEYAPFYILHNGVKIRNNSSKPSHHYKQTLVASFHVVIGEKKHTKLGQFHKK